MRHLTMYQRANIHSTVMGMVTLTEFRFLLRTLLNLFLNKCPNPSNYSLDDALLLLSPFCSMHKSHHVGVSGH